MKSLQWEEEFEDEIISDIAVFKFKNHITKFINKDGNYRDESDMVKVFLEEWLNLNENNKVKIKARKGYILIERMK